MNCEKPFTRVDSLRRHQKHSCKKMAKQTFLADDQPTSILRNNSSQKHVNANNKVVAGEEEDILRRGQKHDCNKKTFNKHAMDEQPASRCNLTLKQLNNISKVNDVEDKDAIADPISRVDDLRRLQKHSCKKTDEQATSRSQNRFIATKCM